MIFGFSMEAHADPVPWSNERYIAGADGVAGYGSPPYVLRVLNGFSRSVVSSYHLLIESGAHYWVYAVFQGEYTAANPMFQFTYGLSSYDPHSGVFYDGAYAPDGGFSFGLNVYDLTDSIILYSGLPPDNSDIINVSTPVSHDISVSFSMEFSGANGTAILHYSTAVVPEPVSSTLFVIGGATLGFRQWRKKKTS